MNTEVLDYISLIRDTATKEMVRIFTCGGCYQFHLILKSRFPDAQAYKILNESGNIKHVVTRINNRFYDINGEIKYLESFIPMNNEDIVKAESFKYPVIQKNEIELRNKRFKNIKTFIRISNVFIVFLLVIINAFSFSNFGYVGFWNLILGNITLGIALLTLKYVLKSHYLEDVNFCRYCGNRIN